MVDKLKFPKTDCMTQLWRGVYPSLSVTFSLAPDLININNIASRPSLSVGKREKMFYKKKLMLEFNAKYIHNNSFVAKLLLTF